MSAGPPEQEGNEPRRAGERLAAGRERMGLSQAKVAEQLRLATAIVVALEAGDYKQVGAQVFVRGYLRRYAELIGESPESYAGASQMHSWGDQSAELTSTRLKALAGTSDRRAIGPWPVLLVALLLCVIAVVWWAQRAAAPRAAAARDPSVLQQEVVVAPPTLAGTGTPRAAGTSGVAVTTPEAAAATPAGKTVSTARLAPTSAAVAPVPAPVPAPVTAPETAPVAAKAPAAAPPGVAAAKAAAVAPGVIAAAKPAVAAPGPAPAPALLARPASSARTATSASAATSGRRQLRLSFSGESWAEVYDAEGTRLYWDLGQGGQGRTVSGVPPFKIILGNPALVSLAYEGKALALPAPRFGTTLHATLDGNGALAAER